MFFGQLVYFILSVTLGEKWQPTLGTNCNRPVVQLPQGRVIGRSVSARNIDPETQVGSRLHLDLFLGIPFAQPPLGNLRFQKPLPIPDKPSRLIDADRYGLACMQPVGGFAGRAISEGEMSENCLTINVIRPSGIGKASSLPVMVWIYGGALISGDSGSVDDTHLVAHSIRMGRPIIYVSFNYRLNIFGFLASGEVEGSESASLNAGFHDQRFALQWVQRNIHKFGGDPTKVTIFGESAGGASVAVQMLWGPGNNTHDKSSIQQPLFRGAILQSGFMLGMPVHKPSFLQDGFNSFAELVNCTDRHIHRRDANKQASMRMRFGSPTEDILSCLRRVSTKDLLFAMMKTLSSNLLDLWKSFGPVIDGDNAGSDGIFFPERTSLLLKSGRFTQIPVILGTVLDEGTTFAPHRIKNEEELRSHIKQSWIHYQGKSNEDVLIDKFFALYPDNPRLGSPYESLFDGKPPAKCIGHLSPQARDGCNRIFPPLSSNQYKRMSSMTGDAVFDSGRRALSLHMSQRQKDAPVWSYVFNQPAKWSEDHLGVSHSSEIPYVFGAFAEEQSEHGVVSNMMSSAWIHFAYEFDPNGNGTNGPHWPKFTSSGREMLEIRSGGFRVVKDRYREDAMEWMGNDAEWNFVTGR